jgi:hypothetical protein
VIAHAIRWDIHGSYLIYDDSTFGSCQTRYWYLPIEAGIMPICPNFKKLAAAAENCATQRSLACVKTWVFGRIE